MDSLTEIKVEHLFKRFGNLTVLDDISFELSAGENLVVFGRSGTGKSVLLKCLIGLLKPDAGNVFIKGKNIYKLSIKKLNNLRKKTGFLFQSSALYDSMTVRENLEFPLKRNNSFTQEELNKKVEKTLDLVHLSEAIDKMPSELSGGMKKRIGLARSIITEPEIMFYDEPTTGLDPITSKNISELIRDLQRKLNMTSIIVTHDLICAEIIADRAIFLRNRKVVYEGKIGELIDSDDQFLKNFFNRELIKT